MLLGKTYTQQVHEPSALEKRIDDAVLKCKTQDT